MESIEQIKKRYFYQNDKIPAFIVEDLLLWVINKNKTFLIANSDYVLTDIQYQDFIKGMEKLNSKIPLAYIIGKQAFYGRDFIVNPYTLIPRPDTEILIDCALNFIKNRQITNPKILDLGTGSGCLAITLAKELPDSQVMAVDFCSNALKIAYQNAKNLQAHHCQFIRSDWFDKLSVKFDLIVSNPPYIAVDDEHLDELIAEPITALVANNNGLSDIENIIENSNNHLNHLGALLIEHGFNQSKSVQKIFKNFGFIDICTIKDYGGNDRITMGIYNESAHT